MVNVLNPEAGFVPVPDEPELVRAAVHAAEIAWYATPYYSLRYGSRGWAFTKSDMAWMTTLPAGGLDYTRSQTRWFCRVLSSRGMPSVLVEDRLRILRRVLDRTAPERSAEWTHLETVRHELATDRCSILPEKAMWEKAKEFAVSAGAPDVRLVVRTGRLLVSAVVDVTLLDSPRSVESIREWFADEDRFPHNWTSAVRRVLES